MQTIQTPLVEAAHAWFVALFSRSLSIAALAFRAQPSFNSMRSHLPALNLGGCMESARIPQFTWAKYQLEEMHATVMNSFSAQIEAEMEKLEWCDLMIWQFPLWWFGLPAVFKGWVDRVFAMGRIYGGERIYETGVFRGKRALLSLTTGGPEEAYRKGAFNGDITAILRPIHRGMLQFVGFDILAPQIVYGPIRLTDEQRKQHLASYAKRLQAIAHESPIEVGIY